MNALTCLGQLSNEPEVDDLMNILKNEVNTKKNKNVDILHLANYICRRLTGKRFNFNSNIFFFISILSSMIRIFALNFLISLSSSGVNPFWPFTYL